MHSSIKSCFGYAEGQCQYFIPLHLYKVKHVTTMSANATAECLIVMVTQEHSVAKVYSFSLRVTNCDSIQPAGFQTHTSETQWAHFMVTNYCEVGYIYDNDAYHTQVLGGQHKSLEVKYSQVCYHNPSASQEQISFNGGVGHTQYMNAIILQSTLQCKPNLSQNHLSKRMATHSVVATKQIKEESLMGSQLTEDKAVWQQAQSVKKCRP